MRDNNEFESVCRSLPEKSVLFCHQTFDGSQLENGFYAPEGANPDCVKHLSRVIVGHIHSSQSVGENIWYPGTPFQQSFSEAGQKKAIFHMSIGLDSMQYCQMEHTISLDMPTYEEVSLKSLTERLPEPSLNTSFKIKGKGTPQEISAFKSSSQFKKLVDGSRRVVDDLSVIRDVTEMQDLIKSAANKTTAEKIQDFVNSKNWKSDKEALIGRARSFLTQ
jgi:DNA repair exonuclease SbcCD nuclease subunit